MDETKRIFARICIAMHMEKENDVDSAVAEAESKVAASNT